MKKNANYSGRNIFGQRCIEKTIKLEPGIAYQQAIEMIDDVNGLEWASKVPVALPIYNIAGDEDPCGSYGEGVKLVSSWLEETGHNVKTKLYEGYRHEIHNYADLKCEVEAGIVAFLDGVLEV
jgi:alpha-beta hydrolase superfamily lysophospholipase